MVALLLRVAMLLHHVGAVEGQRAFVVAGPRGRESEMPEEAVRGVRFTVAVLSWVFHGEQEKGRIITHAMQCLHQPLPHGTSIFENSALLLMSPLLTSREMGMDRCHQAISGGSYLLGSYLLLSK